MIGDEDSAVTTGDLGEQLAGEDESLKYSQLLQLSGLGADEIVDFKLAWPSVPPERKHELLEKLVGLAEDGPELDFTGTFRACLDDSDEDVREVATRGLWECDDRAIIRPLIGLLDSDPSAKVRAAAGMSLRGFTAMAQEGKLRSRDVDRILSALIAAIERPEEDLEVMRRAIEAVASLKSPEIEKIIRDAYDSGVPEMAQSALYAMGQSSDPQWLPTVVADMDQEHAAIRYEAANAAGLLGDETTVPRLIKLIEDDDLQVQLAAVGALGIIGGSLAKRALKQCLKLDDEELEEAAQAALDELEFDDDPLGIRFEV